MRKCVWWVNQHVAFCIFGTISQMTFLSDCSFIKYVRMMRSHWDCPKQISFCSRAPIFRRHHMDLMPKLTKSKVLKYTSFDGGVVLIRTPSNGNYNDDDNNTNGGTEECAYAYHRRPQHHQPWRDLGHVFVSRRPMHGWIGCFMHVLARTISARSVLNV